MKRIVYIVVLVGIIAGGVLLWNSYQSKQNTVSNFAECAAAGNPIMESYPRQCRAGGKTFTEDIGGEKKDLVRVSVPNEGLTSPLTLTGEARGNWFFEASFPVVLLDKNGKEIAQTSAQTQGEWMTEDFVPFTATLEFTAPAGEKGTIVFKKANPSGLPENDNELSLSVTLGNSEK